MAAVSSSLGLEGHAEHGNANAFCSVTDGLKGHAGHSNAENSSENCVF